MQNPASPAHLRRSGTRGRGVYIMLHAFRSARFLASVFSSAPAAGPAEVPGLRYPAPGSLGSAQVADMLAHVDEFLPELNHRAARPAGLAGTVAPEPRGARIPALASPASATARPSPATARLSLSLSPRPVPHRWQVGHHQQVMNSYVPVWDQTQVISPCDTQCASPASLLTACRCLSHRARPRTSMPASLLELDPEASDRAR